MNRNNMSSKMKGRKEAAPSREVKLVLLGRTGSGKSSTANSILSCTSVESKVTWSTVSQRCHGASGDHRGRHISLLDTSGLLDTQRMSTGEVQRELGRCMTLLAPGPHAFLLVLRICRFTQEEREAVGQIQRALGSRAFGFCVIVFTHGDCLAEGTNVRDYLSGSSEGLAELVARCGGRYCVFNNRASKTEEQVSELLALVDSMVDGNRGGCYTGKMLEEAEEKVARELQEQGRLAKEKEELARRQEEGTLKEWYQMELEKIQLRSKRRIEELRRDGEMQREREEALAREREETARREKEESGRREKERVLEIRREEEMLHAQLKKITKTVEELKEREERMKREMEQATQKVHVESNRKERERHLQQLEREHAIMQRERMRRDALYKELNRLTQTVEEQRSKEGQREREREELVTKERRENQREREKEMEKQRAEMKKTAALQREVWRVTMVMKEQKEKEEKMKRELDEMLQWEEERRREGGECLRDGPVSCSVLPYKRPAEECGTLTALVRPVAGYAQEMGLMATNVALESVGAPCSVQ